MVDETDRQTGTFTASMKHSSGLTDLTYRVVEAWAMMLPPIGFLGSANIDAIPSTDATT